MEFWRTIEWLRPAGLLALVLPVIVWLLALRPDRPRPVYLGTFQLFAGALESEPSGERRRRQTPARWLLIVALFLGALALAGPRERVAPSASAPFTVIVDRSPSMYLEHPQGGTRLDAALDRLAGWSDLPASLLWVSAGPGRMASEVGDALPAAWRRAPAAPYDAPDWWRFDTPDTIWLTDRAPAPPPARAGFAASGGAAVPGAVAVENGQRIVWDGSFLRAEPGPPAGSVALLGALPEALESLIVLWAEERGLEIDRASDADARLAIVASLEESPGAWSVERDGWRARVKGGATPLIDTDGRPLSVWLAARDGESEVPLVTWRPGRVWVGVQEMSLQSRDPERFALSWARFLDGAGRPAAGVVALDERRSAGVATFRAPLLQPTGSVDARRPISAWLATVAAACALLALVAKGGALRLGAEPG